MTSPCIKVCVVDDVSGFCIGCGRTREEIGAWKGLSEGEKQDIVDKLSERFRVLIQERPRRGGHRGRLSTLKKS